MDSHVHSRLRLPDLNKLTKIILALIIIAIVACGGILAFKKSDNNSPPVHIRDQMAYKAVYPSSEAGAVDQSSYQYLSDQKGLTFNLDYSGNKVVFTEQPAPSSIGTGSNVYYPALGVHPYAQFQSKLGPVALTKFYKPGNLQELGQSGILVTQGTLVIAHSDKNLSNDQWKQLFDQLKITQ